MVRSQVDLKSSFMQTKMSRFLKLPFLMCHIPFGKSFRSPINLNKKKYNKYNNIFVITKMKILIQIIHDINCTKYLIIRYEFDDLLVNL